MSYNDPKDVESVLQAPTPPPPIAPNLLRQQGLALSTELARATPFNAPTPPAATPTLVRVGTNGIAAGTENPRAAQIGVPVPPQATTGTVAVLIGSPTLTTAAPIQPSPAPRVAGAQMLPPNDPATQTATQLTMQPPPSPTQTASQISAPQTMIPISTLTPQP